MSIFSWFKKKDQPIPLMTTAAPAVQQRTRDHADPAPATPAVQKPQPPLAATPSHSIDLRAECVRSVISAGEVIEGTLRFQNGVKVDGFVKGSIEFGVVDGLFVLGSGGIVEGNILGPRAIIIGEVFGNVVIEGKLILLPNSCIHGDIAAGTLQVMEGATINGRISTFSDYEKRRTLDYNAGAEVTAGKSEKTESSGTDHGANVLRVAQFGS